MEPIPNTNKDAYINTRYPLSKPKKESDFDFSFAMSGLLNDELLSVEKVIKHVENLLEKCKEAYYNHCLEKVYIENFVNDVIISQANEFLQHCLEIKEKLKGKALEMVDSLLISDKNLYDTIKFEHEYMLKVLKELNTTDGWTADSIGSGVDFFYKQIPNTQTVTLKLESDIDVPIQNMLTLVNEIDLWDHWVPFMKRAYGVKRIHRSAAIYYAELGLPYPLHNREVHLYGYGVNRLQENGSILILAESVDDDLEFFERNGVKKVENSGTVNMDVHFAGFEISPIGRNKCRLRGVANMNPKFNWVPISVLNFVLKKAYSLFKGIRFVMDRLISKAKNFKGSVWEKEMTREEKKAFYEWLNQVVEEYYQQQSQKLAL